MAARSTRSKLAEESAALEAETNRMAQNLRQLHQLNQTPAAELVKNSGRTPAANTPSNRTAAATPATGVSSSAGASAPNSKPATAVGVAHGSSGNSGNRGNSGVTRATTHEIQTETEPEPEPVPAEPVAVSTGEMQTERPKTQPAVSYTETAHGTSHPTTKQSYFQHLQTSEAALVKELLANPPDKTVRL
eukprot:TRINITY_DN6195_c0_g2_i1.p2 TRINITY_DN6195_c0_g2~~TRINITY_DN6195_c0_g2_i1.p2  ORF type:complete len:214 (-),score=68.80 TRINITY_DN6195_c0_g2_i1:320-889(-)